MSYSPPPLQTQGGRQEVVVSDGRSEDLLEQILTEIQKLTFVASVASGIETGED